MPSSPAICQKDCQFSMAKRGPKIPATVEDRLRELAERTVDTAPQIKATIKAEFGVVVSERTCYRYIEAHRVTRVKEPWKWRRARLIQFSRRSRRRFSHILITLTLTAVRLSRLSGS